MTDTVGLASYQIQNLTAKYVMQQSTGGFSEIIDNDGNDWVGFNSSSGSAGEARGLPNLGVPDGQHPYDPVGNFPSSGAANTATVNVAESGPLETTVDVGSANDDLMIEYQFFNNFVNLQINGHDASFGTTPYNYSFVYNGTPGGSFSSGDRLLTSDGTNQTLNQSYDAPNGIGAGNSTTGQWAAFQSQNENRFIYFAQDTQDTNEDSYYDANNQMTVFGYGLTAPGSSPSAAPEESEINSYTFGIENGNSSAATTINSQYRDVIATPGLPSVIGP